MAVMDSAFDCHGRIKCGTVVTPDFAGSLGDYTGGLALTVADSGAVPAALAAAWGAPASAGKRTALLTPATGAPGYLRLVEGTTVAGYTPLRSHGWAAFELTVRDAHGLHEALPADAFRVIGAPKLVPGFDNFIPFQVVGRGGEVLYLNQVLNSRMAGLDLPAAHATVDHMFIAVLAAPDRAAALAAHVALGFEAGETWTIPYSVINDSFGLPADTLTAMTMTQVGRLPATEIDQYPPAATRRPRAPGELPPGNAMVSFIVRTLDGLPSPFVAPPAVHAGPLYAGRRSACVVGAAGELIELIEA